MEPQELDRLAARARRAYELGRARSSIAAVWPVLPIAAVAAVVGEVGITLVLAAVLAGVCATLVFVGRGLDVAVETGFKAGAVPMVVALALWEGQGCAGPAMPWCMPMCAIPSLLVGIWLGTKIGGRGRAKVVGAALVVSSLTASLGCVALGFGSLLGVVLGLAVGLGPTWAVQIAAARR